MLEFFCMEEQNEVEGDQGDEANEKLHSSQKHFKEIRLQNGVAGYYI